jgi:hypothetical protein
MSCSTGYVTQCPAARGPRSMRLSGRGYEAPLYLSCHILSPSAGLSAENGNGVDAELNPPLLNVEGACGGSKF